MNRKNPKNLDTRKNAAIILKIRRELFYYRWTGPKDVDTIVNSVDPDQTAPLGAVWSESTLLAQTCQSENLGTLWYHIFFIFIMLYNSCLHRYLYPKQKRIVLLPTLVELWLIVCDVSRLWHNARLTKSCPECPPSTTSGAIYSMVPQNE